MPSQPELMYADEILEGEGFINNDPWALANGVGVTILSDKNFVCGHVTDTVEGKLLVSASFDAYNAGNSSYSFDTVVHRLYQGQGLGAELIDLSMRRFKNEILDMDPEAVLDLDVVNKEIVPYLERVHGLTVKQESGGHTIMGVTARHLVNAIDMLDNDPYSSDKLTVYFDDLIDGAKDAAEKLVKDLNELTAEMRKAIDAPYQYDFAYQDYAPSPDLLQQLEPIEATVHESATAYKAALQEFIQIVMQRGINEKDVYDRERLT